MTEASAALASSVVLDRFVSLWEQGEGGPDLSEFLRQAEPLSPRELTDILLVDQSFRWRSGCPRPVEEYFSAWPQTAADSELRLDLVYGELRAILDRGDSSAVERLWRGFLICARS